MRDIEIILRFFALRHADHYQKGMKGFLDLYMVRARAFTDEDVALLRSTFEKTVNLGAEVYGDLAARPWDKTKKQWAPRAHVAFSDAVMVGLSRHLDERDRLVSIRENVIEATKQLFEQHPEGTFTGRGNTKLDVQTRIRLFDAMLNDLLG